MDAWSSASQIAEEVASGRATARYITQNALDRIESTNQRLNAFTSVTRERALAKADAIDAARACGEVLGPLAGVPYAVKNLFDIEGLATLAGARISRDRAPAKADATLVRRLDQAGAVLVGALNMGEYAYDFTGENEHDGPSRNPHDLARMTGGSSGGSGAAVAGGLVPLALGSDTNGSIRVPASFCGLFGLKPTYGRLSRTGTFPFVTSLDHLGPLARTVRDLALAYDAMLGPDEADPVCTRRAATPSLPGLASGIGGLRFAVAGGYFQRGASSAALEAVDRVAKALGASREIEIPEAARARSAAYVITTTEGAALHLDRLRKQPSDFDPAVRDRLISGAMAPAPLVMAAHKFRRWYRDRLAALFDEVDVILAPATPMTAPMIGEKTLMLDGELLPLRPNIGIFTQPISFAGLPVVAVPVALSPLPIAVQIIAAPWREDVALRTAYWLEQGSIAAAPKPAFATESDPA
jgi:AtzE family amidohydrolase